MLKRLLPLLLALLLVIPADASLISMAGGKGVAAEEGGGDGAVQWDIATHYVNNSGTPACSDSTSKAANSASSPWCTIGRAAWGNANRATPSAAQAVSAGDVVQVTAGTYTTAGFNADEVAYETENDGTSGNPIVFQCAQGSTCTLNLSSPGSAIGCFNNHWVTWRGFLLDDVNNPQFFADGMAHVEVGDGCTLEANTFLGRDEDTLDGDQYCAIFGSDVQDLTIRGNLMKGFGGGQDNSGQANADENATGVTLFNEAVRVVIEHNECLYNGACYYHKGVRNSSGVPDFSTGPVTFRYNLVHDNKRGLILYVANHAEATPLLVYQNLIYDNTFYGISSQWLGGGDSDGDPGEISESKYGKVVNNTLHHNGDYNGSEGRQLFISAYPATRFIEFHNNLLSGAADYTLVYPEATVNSQAVIINRNLYNGADTFGSVNGGNVSFATWQALTNIDETNSVTTAPTYTNAAAFDFTLVSNGQWALTGGEAQSNICGTTGATIAAGAHCDSTTIGIVPP